MEDKVVIQNFIKNRLSLDEGWWFDFLLGAALAEFACGEYKITTTKEEVDTLE